MGRELLTRRRTAPPIANGAGSADVVADQDVPLSRRKVLTAVIGVAAVGVTGAAVLGELAPGQASAQTTTQSGGLAPRVVSLADAPTIDVDASLGNDFRVTLGGSRTIADPVNPSPGQQIIFQVTQGSGGAFTVTWGSSYEFSAGLPQPTLSTAPGQTDLLGFIYNAATEHWMHAAFVSGFSA